MKFSIIPKLKEKTNNNSISKFKRKTYEEIYGNERAKEIKEKLSKATKKVMENPNYRKKLSETRKRLFKEGKLKPPVTAYKKGNIPIIKLNLNEKEIIRLYLEEKKSCKEIAEIFNCSLSVIYNRLKQNNITTSLKGKSFKRRIEIDNKRKEEILDLYGKDYNMKYIANLMNCSSYIIKRTLKENNIEIKIKPSKFYNLDKKKIIDIYKKENISGVKIAKQFGCAPSIIYDILKRNNIPKKGLKFFNKGKVSPNKLKLSRKKIIGMYKKNLSTTKIAEELNCSKNTILRILKENNIRLKGTKFFNKEFKEEKNPNWKGGISKEPYGFDFNPKFKRAIRKRDNYICMLCGIHSEKLCRALDIHHINYNKLMTMPQNCLSLCRKCHNSLVHGDKDKLKYWIKFFQSLLTERYDYQYSENKEIIFKLNNFN